VKLCAVTQSYAPTGGGVRTMLHAQRDWCRDHDMPRVLIVPGDRDAVVRDGPLVTHTVRSPLVPGSSVYRLLLRSRAVLRILRDEMPDIIETHCPYNLPWAALHHRRRHGGIVGAVYMTDLPVAYVEAPLAAGLARVAGRRAAGFVARRARGLAERYLRALYSRCDVVFAISPVTRDRLAGFGVRDVQLVPLGVDLDTFSPARRDPCTRRELGVGEHDLLLAYAGRMDAEKRPDVVLEAFARLRAERDDVTLVLAGDGPLRGSLEARAREVGRAHVLPFIDDRARLARLLASADVYVSAMAHETFGLSVVEAQACGLPVVGVRAGAMTDRVREGADGILVPFAADPAVQAGALADRVATTPAAAWPDMGARGRARVEAEFSWSRTFETMHGIYREAGAARLPTTMSLSLPTRG
jgi:alpha-1,6-mannosyltransferase